MKSSSVASLSALHSSGYALDKNALHGVIRLFVPQLAIIFATDEQLIYLDIYSHAASLKAQCY